MQLGAITHPDPHIDQKVKYFYDCFHYWLMDGVRRIKGFPENHLTYLERMKLRGDVLITMHQSSRMAICSWLRQPEFDTKKDEFSKRETIKPLVSRLRKIASYHGKDFDLPLFRETVNQLIVLLNGEDGLNGTAYFNEVLKAQISFMTCEHNLAKHQKEIMEHAKWLVAEYLRFGFDSKDIKGYRGIFKKILKFEELKTSKKPHSVGFPLPQELKNLRNSKKFKAEFKRYIDNTTFLTQFEGMLHALKETQQGEFILRINGVRKHGSKPFEFSYKGVTLLSFDKLDTSKLNFDSHLQGDFETYFSAPNTIIAKVHVHFKSQEQGLYQARFLIKQTLDALRYVLNDNAGEISTERVILAWPEGGANYSMNGSKCITIHTHDLQLLQKMNSTVPHPENSSPETIHYIDRCNRIFFKGLSSEDMDDRVNCFWQYWETAFNFGKYKETHDNNRKLVNRGELIINDLSKILAKGIKEYVQSEKSLNLFNYVINDKANKHTGIPSMYYNNQLDLMSPTQIIQEIKNFTQYPFLRMLIHRFEKLNDRTEENRWLHFFRDFLWQLYEQRNFIAHDGTYCPATLERLQFFFRVIVVRWQTKLFEELEKVPGCSVEDAVERLLLNE